MKKKKNKIWPHDKVYVRLGISKVHGIGVFAIRDIPRGVKIFAGENEETVWVSRKQVEKLAPELRRLYEDFCILDGDEYGAPKTFNNLSVGWYLNHKAQGANVRCNRNYDFVSKRLIRKGEELTTDYWAICDKPFMHKK